VRALRAGLIDLADGPSLPADAVLVTTHAAAPAWFRDTGLVLDPQGFLAAGPTLQSLGDADVFAAGDCAALVETPRPKAGVFAVRAGPPLAANLRRRARGNPPRPWTPQQRHLALISTGERRAVASRGWFKAEGAWVWTLKDWIDRRWMRMYQDTGRLTARMAKQRPAAGTASPPPEMRCGGCAANHALGDVYAMGGLPRYALAIGVVPPGPAAKVEEALFQVLAGARACLDREGVALVGGHSSEGPELALGFSVTGEVAPGSALRKSGLKPGDALILTKLLGTGILFAGAMRGRTSARAIEAALTEMRRSNRRAAEILIAHGATAMTDVSGFGLAGHLGEMLAASGCDARLDLSAIPVLPEALSLVGQGIASTLLPENLSLRGLIDGEADPATLALLFDPQTAGGLLAGVRQAEAGACVADLHENGSTAAIIGTIEYAAPSASAARITTLARLSAAENS